MISEPHKELRFTRSGQAVGFCVAGAVLAGIAMTLATTGSYRDANLAVPHAAWGIPFAFAATGLFLLARHLAKHAYLILTPMGLEIFPFFRPATRLQMVMWQEIRDAEVDSASCWLTLHFNAEKTAGIRLSMKPVRRKNRSLLAKAVLGRVSGCAT